MSAPVRGGASDPFALASGGPGETPPADPGDTDAGAAALLPAPVLDPADYLPDMAGLDLTEVQKIELLGILWSIMGTMVDMGFDRKTCERILAGAGLIPDAEPDGAMILPSTSGEQPSDDGKDGGA